MPHLESRVLSPAKLSGTEARLWQQFSRDSEHTRRAFLTMTYAQAVDEARSGVRVAVLSRGGEPIAFLPFQFRSSVSQLFRAAEPVGGSMTDYFGLIGRPDVRLSREELLACSRLQYLGFTHLDETQKQHGLGGEQPVCGLLIRFPEGADAYWDSLRTADRKFLDDTIRRQKHLESASGPLRFVFRECSPEALDNLIDCKRQQYGRTGVPDALEESWKRSLLHILARSDAEECRGVLSTLYAGDTWVASHFGLQCHDVLHYWFPVYNPGLSKYSPGRMMVRQLINAGAEHGIRTIDRGAGESQAKRDFSNGSHLFYRGCWQRSSVSAILYRAGLSLQWRAAGPRSRNKKEPIPA